MTIHPGPAPGRLPQHRSPSTPTETPVNSVPTAWIAALMPLVVKIIQKDDLIHVDDRDDVQQDVMLRLWKRVCDNPSHEPRPEHLSTIVRDVRVGHHRMADRVTRNRDKLVKQALNRLARNDASIAEREADLRDHLWAALERLPARMRAVVQALWIEGLSQKELAHQLGISPPSVTRLVRRTTERLRALLAPWQAEILPESR
ncbi:RNA polymerase sigma factor [Gemmata sp. SH-PL17]|uniref:RNA polymerase sigma factor n=1 Tax=Gemmata sp. SH-PL17 TaxID=1630693 RepID=UPI00078B648F|nr:sigma-70 family RNA polymerase sigma factor [Gemmata sp. SH-PL17]AMV24084.1 RNA polymerase sigma factor [Gemmata sp. SH-PL17]